VFQGFPLTTEYRLRCCFIRHPDFERLNKVFQQLPHAPLESLAPPVINPETETSTRHFFGAAFCGVVAGHGVGFSTLC